MVSIFTFGEGQIPDFFKKSGILQRGLVALKKPDFAKVDEILTLDLSIREQGV